MKKALFWIIILILVSVTWFRPLIAETLSSEQIEELKKNPELYHQFLQQKGRKAPNRYTTPDIFERGEGDTLGLDSLEMSVGLPATDRERNDGASAFNDGGSLRPFGLEMFERTGQLAAPIEIANSGNYLLGPGDNLLIYLWGKVEREFNLTIDRQGKLFVPPIGEVVAWGQSLDDFRDRLRDRFRSVYSDFRLNVTLGKIRSIRVYLIGEVKSPGAYTVSSLTTFFNALYQAGGPTERGSLRHIKLLRDGTLLRQIDLYDLLLRGDNSLDITLRSGDAVFVPVVKAQASVTGEVKRPAIYELLGDETVADLLELAGGKTAIGYLRQLSLERVADGNEPKLIDINLDPESSDSNRDFLVLGGDRMTVHSMYDVRRNYVAVGGMVKHPGRFEREDGLTLPGLIERAELRPEDVYQPRLNLFRTHPDNRHEVINVSLQDLLNNPEAAEYHIKLQDRDSVHIYSIDEIERRKYVYIGGEVENPGKYDLFDGMRLSDLIFLAGNPKRAAYLHRAELAHTDSLGEVSLTHIDLTSPMIDEALLQEDDQVYIRQIPEWSLRRRVAVEGDVYFPGEYMLISKDETLWSLLQRAGGFTPTAFPAGLVFDRGSISHSVFRRNLDRVVSSSVALIEDSLGNVQRREDVIYDADNLNRIIVDVPRIVTTHGAEGDVVLQHGDRIFIPCIPSGISVLGAVGASGTIKFEPGKKSRYYLERAGGYTRQADEKHVKLVKADGRVFTGSAARKQIVDLGDAIVVPTEIKKERNFMKSLSSMISVVSGLATSVFIITKL